MSKRRHGFRRNPTGGIEAILETYGNILATDGYNVICRKAHSYDHSKFDIIEIGSGEVVKSVALNNFDFNSIMSVLSEELDLKSPLEEDYDDEE